ncbi:MAG TPA: porin family protein [Chitinophagaceae bacterium]|nr:porin family protein [Chitinophagaceae bacterium]
MLNKHIVLFFIIYLSQSFVYAQKVSLNPEVGINLSSLHHSDSYQDIKNNTIGVKAGLALNIPITKRIFIQPGVYFDMRGARIQEEFNGLVQENDYTLNYLQIPIHLQTELPIGVLGELFVHVGPYVGWGINGRKEVSINNIKEKAMDAFGDDEEQLKNIDFGLNIGAGYRTPFGIYARVQYGYGMGNLSNISSESIQNRVWNIGLGWTIGG